MNLHSCPFCRIILGDAPANVVYRGEDVWVFHPLNPVTPGHLLVVPVEHVSNYTELPEITAKVVEVAARFGNPESSNLITSSGAAATQTVPHLHFHIVPRTDGDGLMLPWSDFVYENWWYYRREALRDVLQMLDDNIARYGPAEPEARSALELIRGNVLRMGKDNDARP